MMTEKNKETIRLTVPTILAAMCLLCTTAGAFAWVRGSTVENKEDIGTLFVKVDDNRERIHQVEKHELERKAEYANLRRDTERVETKIDSLLREMKRLEPVNGTEN